MHQRREHRSKIRQDLLISEYIQLKYFNIYSEAAEFYNTINRKHPTKYDLRKTYEFRKWKASITGEIVKEPKKTGPPRPRPLHPNIQAIPFQNLNPIELNPQAQITVTCVELPQNSTPSEQTSDTRDSQPPTPDTGDSQPPTPDTGDSQPPTPDTGETQLLSPVKLRSGKHVYKDTLQLRIPLIPCKPKTPPVIIEEDTSKHEEHPLELIEPTVTTETLQIVTEEILEEDTIQPSLHEELAPELIEKIINELRTEPDLQDIFTNVEQQIEFEQLGMDIDILEDNALEIELEQW